MDLVQMSGYDAKQLFSASLKPFKHKGVEYKYDFTINEFIDPKTGDPVSKENTPIKVIDKLDKKKQDSGIGGAMRKIKNVQNAFEKFVGDSAYSALYTSADSMPETLRTIFVDNMLDARETELVWKHMGEDAMKTDLTKLFGSEGKAVDMYKRVYGNRSKKVVLRDNGGHEVTFTRGEVLDIYQTARNAKARQRLQEFGMFFKGSGIRVDLSGGKLDELLSKFLTKKVLGSTLQLVGADKILATNSKGEQKTYIFKNKKWRQSEGGKAVINPTISSAMDGLMSERAIMDGQFNFLNGTLKEGLEDFGKEQMGGGVATLEDYWPIVSKYTEQNFIDPAVHSEGEMEALGANYKTTPASISSMHERKDDVKEPLMVKDGWGAYNAHTGNSAKLLGRYGQYMDASKVLNETKESFKNARQMPLWNLLSEQVKDFGGAYKPIGIVDSVGNFLASRNAVSVLTSERTMAKQAPSGMLAALMFKDPVSVMHTLASPALRFFDMKLTKEIVANSSVLRERFYGDFADQVFFNKRGRKKSVFSVTAVLGERLMKMTLGRIDWTVMKGIYLGAKREARAEYRKGNIAKEDISNYVNRKVAEVILITQPDSDVISKTRLQKEKSVAARSLTMFSSQSAKLYQVTKMGAHDITSGITTMNPKKVATGMSKVAIATALNGAIMGVINSMTPFEEMDEESLEHNILLNVLKSLFAMHPVGKLVTDPFINSVMGERTFSNSHVMYEAFDDMQKIVEGVAEGDVDGATIAKFVTSLSGMPKRVIDIGTWMGDNL